MKKTAAGVVAAVTLVVGGVVGGRLVPADLPPLPDNGLCYVRQPGAVVGSCQCQGNEQVPNRSPMNVANFPEWGDCGEVPRPARLMRGTTCVPVDVFTCR